MLDPQSDADRSRELTPELRRRRSDQRNPGADLVPVEGGEPIPADDPAPEQRPVTF